MSEWLILRIVEQHAVARLLHHDGADRIRCRDGVDGALLERLRQVVAVKDAELHLEVLVRYADALIVQGALHENRTGIGKSRHADGLALEIAERLNRGVAAHEDFLAARVDAAHSLDGQAVLQRLHELCRHALEGVDLTGADGVADMGGIDLHHLDIEPFLGEIAVLVGGEDGGVADAGRIGDLQRYRPFGSGLFAAAAAEGEQRGGSERRGREQQAQTAAGAFRQHIHDETFFLRNRAYQRKYSGSGCLPP